jgi:hypothetical protein
LSSPPPTSSALKQQGDKFILPIFPLRKRVKFPTESIQLTLWEERYKALSRYVLDYPSPLILAWNEDHSGKTKRPLPIFGALYCSHKAQIVKGGKGAITPVVEPDDIGVICCVTNSQVFVDGEEVDVSRRHEDTVEKIRLWGLGLARFRVIKVLSNGYDDDYSSDDDEIDCKEKNCSLPFILVEAVRFDDNDGDKEEAAEYGAYGTLGIDDQHASDEIDSRMEQLMLRCSDDAATRERSIQASSDPYSRFVFQSGDENTSSNQNMMLTFALLSQLEATAPAGEMLDMLRTRSMMKRSDYLDRKIPRSTKTWLRDILRIFVE